jgi:hypothetical protein
MSFPNPIQSSTFPPDHSKILPEKHERVEDPMRGRPVDERGGEQSDGAFSISSTKPSLTSTLLDRAAQSEPAPSGSKGPNTVMVLMDERELLKPVGNDPKAVNDHSHKLDVPALATWVSVQSLLVQFSSPRVRADLINGKFGCHINPQLLLKLDDLRWTLLPRWQSGSIITIDTRKTVVVDHMFNLLNKSDELLLMDLPERCPTYKEWFNMLETIAADRYWSRVPCEQRCVHIGASNTEDSVHSEMAPIASPPRNSLEIGRAHV